jgi:hypothetical protein
MVVVLPKWRNAMTQPDGHFRAVEWFYLWRGSIVSFAGDVSHCLHAREKTPGQWRFTLWEHKSDHSNGSTLYPPISVSKRLIHNAINDNLLPNSLSKNWNGSRIRPTTFVKTDFRPFVVKNEIQPNGLPAFWVIIRSVNKSVSPVWISASDQSAIFRPWPIGVNLFDYDDATFDPTISISLLLSSLIFMIEIITQPWSHFVIWMENRLKVFVIEIKYYCPWLSFRWWVQIANFNMNFTIRLKISRAPLHQQSGRHVQRVSASAHALIHLIFSQRKMTIESKSLL